MIINKLNFPDRWKSLIVLYQEHTWFACTKCKTYQKDRYDIKGVTLLLGIVFLTNNKQAITFIIQRTFIADKNKAFKMRNKCKKSTGSSWCYAHYKRFRFNAT